MSTKKNKDDSMPNDDKFAHLKEMAEKMREGKYISRDTDIIGYWLPELSPIHCIPRVVKLFDNGMDKKKPSALLIVTLVSACTVKPATDLTDDDVEVEPITAPVGSMVGVWVKAGMKGIRDCADIKVLMFLKGEKDVGKGNPMKVYSIEAASDVRKRVPVIEDTRDKSRNEPTFFTDTQVSGRHKESEFRNTKSDDSTPQGTDDDIPF